MDSGNKVVTTSLLDTSATASYDITVKAVDQYGREVEHTQTVWTVGNNTAPTDLFWLTGGTAGQTGFRHVGQLSVLDPDAAETFRFDID